MSFGKIEHVNYTVADPDKTARMLEDVFGWKVRWSGPSKGGGYTVHVGNNDDYVALYRPPEEKHLSQESYTTIGGVNHLGVLVEDLEKVEGRVKAAGLTPHSHQEYDPGRRFYFHDSDNIEYEVVSYT